jgi:hypothetical protein
MNRLFHVGFAVLALTASGCNDDPAGSSAGTPISPPPAAPVPPAQPTQGINCATVTFIPTAHLDALPGGVWQGSLVDCENNVEHDGVTAMISEDGRFRIIAENEHLLAGELQTTRDLFRGWGIDFAAAGVEYFSGPTTNLFVEGLVAERQSLAGRWGTEWGFYGYFTFDYVQQTYERPTSFTDLAGVWPTYATFSGVPVEGSWTIEEDGRFNGQDDRGCLQSGQFSLIDNRYSIVSVQLTVMACELAGSYSGLAQLEDLVDWGDTAITVSVDDGARALRIVLLN